MLKEMRTVLCAGNTMVSNLNSILKARLAINVLNRLSSDSLVVYMTIYLSNTLGVELTGIYTILLLSTGFVINLYGGAFIDARSSKGLLTVGWGIHTAAMLAMLIFFNDMCLLMTAYFIKNIIFSFILPAGEKLIYSNTTTENRRYFFQLNGWFSGISSAVAVFIGGYAYEVGVFYVIAFSSAMSLCVFIGYELINKLTRNDLSRTEVTSSAGNVTHNKKPSLRDYNILLLNKKSLYIIISAVFLTGIEFSFGQYIPYLISGMKYDIYLLPDTLSGVEFYSWVKTITTVFGLVFSFYLISKIKHLGEVKAVGMMFFAIFIFVIINFIILIKLDNPFVFLVLSVLSGLMGIIYHPVRYAEYMNTVEERNSGVYLSAYSLVGRVGNIYASIILMVSDIIGRYGVATIVLLTGLLSLLFLSIGLKSLNIKKTEGANV